jgi:hypothetical protein
MFWYVVPIKIWQPCEGNLAAGTEMSFFKIIFHFVDKKMVRKKQLSLAQKDDDSVSKLFIFRRGCQK